MKKCAHCKVEKPASEFGSSKRFKDGLRTWCKVCDREYALAWRNANRDRALKNLYEWRSKNLDYERDYRKRKYAECDKAESSRRSVEWGRKNAERKRIIGLPYKRARQMRQREATPKWANMFFIREIYHLSILRSRLTGVRHEVDHIVPMHSKMVCGLHCEQNLAVIPKLANRIKLNKEWPDMPDVL